MGVMRQQCRRGNDEPLRTGQADTTLVDMQYDGIQERLKLIYIKVIERTASPRR